MSETNGETRITYTVKELLTDMDRRHSAQLDSIQASVKDLGIRVATLERNDLEESAIRGWSSKLVGASAIIATLAINVVTVLISTGRFS